MDELEILEARRVRLMEKLGASFMPREQANAIIEELAEIESAIQRYGGAMDTIGDAKREARFGVGL
jgi:hypothetical protein